MYWKIVKCVNLFENIRSVHQDFSWNFCQINRKYWKILNSRLHNQKYRKHGITMIWNMYLLLQNLQYSWKIMAICNTWKVVIFNTFHSKVVHLDKNGIFSELVLGHRDCTNLQLSKIYLSTSRFISWYGAAIQICYFSQFSDFGDFVLASGCSTNSINLAHTSANSTDSESRNGFFRFLSWRGQPLVPSLPTILVQWVRILSTQWLFMFTWYATNSKWI